MTDFDQSLDSARFADLASTIFVRHFICRSPVYDSLYYIWFKLQSITNLELDLP